MGLTYRNATSIAVEIVKNLAPKNVDFLKKVAFLRRRY
jgi:hypothetical protein